MPESHTGPGVVSGSGGGGAPPGALPGASIPAPSFGWLPPLEEPVAVSLSATVLVLSCFCWVFFPSDGIIMLISLSEQR